MPLQNGKKIYGFNSFCEFNKLVIQDPDEVERLLLEPQKRGNSLGLLDLIPGRSLTDKSKEPLNLWEISDVGVDSNRRKQLQDALKTLIASPECLARVNPSDSVMSKIIAKLLDHVSSAPNVKAITDKAIPKFLLRALHWAVLELDLDNRDFDILYECYCGGKSPFLSRASTWNVRGFGNVFSDSRQTKLFKRAEHIYMRSRLINNWQVKAEYANCSSEGMARMVIGMFSTVAMQGPLNLIHAVLTGANSLIPPSFEIPLANTTEER